MKKITFAIAIFLTVSLVFTSCENTKKGAEKDAKELKKETKKVGEKIETGAKKVGAEVEKDAKIVGEAVKEKGTEMKNMAMGVEYQCPMKCEGDKTYHEEGKCPKCGMEMKKMEKSDDGHDH